MEYKEMGCLGVDMEYSALLAVAKYRRVKLGQFFMVQIIWTAKYGSPGI